MFRTTEDSSSRSLVQYLAENYKNGSILSVDMDVVGVMAAYVAITPTTSISTDTIESFLPFLAKHCTRLPDDGSPVVRNMSEQF